MEQTIWPGVVDDIPIEFRGFMFNDPVLSIGTTFCIWRKNTDASWQVGNIKYPNNKYGDGSEDLLYILDGNPATYQQWAWEYYLEEDGEKHHFEAIKHIYEGKPITKEIIEKLNPEQENIPALKKDLDGIGYPYSDF